MNLAGLGFIHSGLFFSAIYKEFFREYSEPLLLRDPAGGKVGMNLNHTLIIIILSMISVIISL